MKKAELLDHIHSTYQEWEHTLAKVPRQKMEIQGAAGVWSLKDVIAHITWGEREMVGVLKTRLFEGSPLWNLDTDTRNQIVYEENKERLLEEILSESRQVHKDLLTELEKLEDQDLTDPSRIRNLPMEWQLWQVLKGNTYEHYQEHTAYLRASGIFEDTEGK